MDDILPNFSPEQLYAEQRLILRLPEGEYGEITALFPLDLNGNPDPSRPPIIRGKMHVVGTTSQGGQVQVPIVFVIPVVDLLQAAFEFKACANQAIAEFQSEQFRRNVIKPGILAS